MIAKIAQIREDHTWTEMEVQVDHLDYFDVAASRALAKARAILDNVKYSNIIALHVLGVEEAKASCSTIK